MFPKLIEDLSANNKLELDTLLGCGLPWLKLDYAVPEFNESVFTSAVSQSTDWRTQWGFNDKYKGDNNDSQVKGWNGQLLFGPHNWEEWIKIYTDKSDSDEDEMCKRYRQDIEFSWRLQEDHPIRQFVESIFPNPADINIVNFYTLPPGGYLFPHVDPSIGNKALNKIYIPLLWEHGNEFGFYQWGNIPIHQGDVYLINNYRYAHWVCNKSNSYRVVLDIGANLNSISEKIIKNFLCSK